MDVTRGVTACKDDDDKPMGNMGVKTFFVTEGEDEGLGENKANRDCFLLLLLLAIVLVAGVSSCGADAAGADVASSSSSSSAAFVFLETSTPNCARNSV